MSTVFVEGPLCFGVSGVFPCTPERAKGLAVSHIMWADSSKFPLLAFLAVGFVRSCMALPGYDFSIHCTSTLNLGYPEENSSGIRSSTTGGMVPIFGMRTTVNFHPLIFR